MNNAIQLRNKQLFFKKQASHSTSQLGDRQRSTYCRKNINNNYTFTTFGMKEGVLTLKVKHFCRIGNIEGFELKHINIVTLHPGSRCTSSSL